MTELADLASLARMGTTTGRYHWAAVAAALGAMPPPDYVELINTYGGGTIDRDITIFEPGSHAETYDLLRSYTRY